ncbi:MAG: hypothetical protein ACLP8X_17265 [Streptosporangiaceae bacterium]
MTHPAAGSRTPPASPFTRSRVCAAAGLTIAAGGRPVLFDQDLWDFREVEGLPVQLHPGRLRLDFTLVTDPRWRQVAKEYIFARLAPAHPAVAVLPGACRVPLTLQTCRRRMPELAGWLNWLTSQQVPALENVTQDHCDRYLAERRRKDNAGQVTGTLSPGTLQAVAAVIIELGAYAELFTADRYRDGFTPWRGRTASQVAGFRSGGENKTPSVDQQLLQPLLAAAFYLTGALGPHVLALRDSVRDARLASAGPRTARAGRDELGKVLQHHLNHSEPLVSVGVRTISRRLGEGWAADDPLLPVSYQALARAAGAKRLDPHALADARPAIVAVLGKVGTAKPWGRGAAEVTTADGAASLPWTLPLDTLDLQDMTGLLRTSCLVITSAVTGMRSSELMELRSGCRRATVTSAGMTRYRLAGKLIKGQGLGGTADEWVVVPEIDQAVALAEQLCDDTSPDAPVFGRFGFPERYHSFRAWVNGPPGQRLGLAPIPDGIANPRRLRRTLAMELAYRPGGLLAAKIHLKHVSACTAEGYSARPGGAQARLLAEIGEAEAGRNLDLIRQEFGNYQNGIMPAGPGARELTAFFAHVDGDLAAYAATAPSVAATDQHLLNLLSKRAGVLHLGAANYCWFTNPSQALCLRLAGTPDAGAPLIGMCDSTRCPQATHHPCHRDVWAETVTANTVFLGMLGRTRKTEHTRLQAELDRAQRVVDAIDAAAPEGR